MYIPSLHGNWVDLVIILLMIYYLWGINTRGFIIETLEFASLFLSFILSLKYYTLIGNLIIANFSLPHGISNAFGFLLVGFISQTVISKLISLFYEHIYIPVSKTKLTAPVMRLDNMLGFIPKIGEIIVIIAFFLTLIIALPVQGAIKNDILESRLGQPLVSKTQTIEKQINSIFTPAINETLTFLTVEPSSNETVNLHFTTTDVKVDTSSETRMLDLVNQARTQAGIKKLSVDSKLTELARSYGKEMFSQGYFSHNDPKGQSPFDRMNKAGINFQAAGENLALAPNVSFAFTGLMNSPGHRANILSTDFNKVGIGVINGGIYGEMFVQEFTN